VHLIIQRNNHNPIPVGLKGSSPGGIMFDTTKDPNVSTNPEKVVRKAYQDEPCLYVVEPYPDTRTVFHFIRLNPEKSTTQDLRSLLSGDDIRNDEKGKMWSKAIYVVFGKLNWVAKLELEKNSDLCLASQILRLATIDGTISPITRLYYFIRLDHEKFIFIYKPPLGKPNINEWLEKIAMLHNCGVTRKTTIR
jgi:hypothetical protein